MARYDNRDRILAVGSPHGAHRFRRFNGISDVRVAAGLSIWNPLKLAPDLLLKWRAARVKPQIERLQLPREIRLELFHGGKQRGMRIVANAILGWQSVESDLLNSIISSDDG